MAVYLCISFVSEIFHDLTERKYIYLGACFNLLSWDDREMSDASHVIQERIIIGLSPLIPMAVHIGYLIHDEMNMDMLRVGMHRVDHLILRCVMLDDFLCVIVCLLRRDVFVCIKTQYGVADSFALVLAESNGRLLHLLGCCLRCGDIASTDVGRFCSIEYIVHCVLILALFSHPAALPA